MEISVVIAKTSFTTTEGDTIHGVVTGSGKKIWKVDETIAVGNTVIITSEKYKNADGVFKTRHSVAKIKLG